MSRITAAQRRATAHLTTTSTPAPATADYGTCEDCGKPLEGHEFNRCTACVIARGDGVLKANSVTFFEQDTKHDIITQARRREARKRRNWQQVAYAPTCDGIEECETCPLRGTEDCEAYQKHLSQLGRENETYGPYATQMDAEKAGAFSPRFD